MRLVMTLKVRDEADIISDNLRFHRAMGVDFFVVTDNGSVDGTSEILERYVAAGLAHVIQEPTSGLRSNEMDWTTRMARLAASEYGADWVFNNDADEFWWPLTGTIKDVLASIPEEYGGVVSPRAEYVARPDGPGSFADRLVAREARSNLQPKVAHRGDPDVVVLSNTHEVASAGGGDLFEALRPPGRVVHRGVRGADDDEEGAGLGIEEMRLVWAPTHPLRIFHFPLRSYEQFKKRTEIFLHHGGFRDTGRFRRLRVAYEEGRLDEIYSGLIWDDAAVEEGIREGKLVRDDRLAKLLPRCPDPLSGAPAASVAVELDPDALERERAEVELDTLRLMARTQRFHMVQLERSRQRIDELHAANKELRSKLGRTLGRRLLKLTRRRRRAERELEPAAADGAQPTDAE
jgi:Glycosyl transferase family 2